MTKVKHKLNGTAQKSQFLENNMVKHKIIIDQTH